MGEKAILFQAVVPTGEWRLMMNAWFKIQPTLKISGPFHARPPPFCLGISSTFVRSSLYTIGGQVPNHFVLSDCISWVNTGDAFNVWETSTLPSPCADPVIGVYNDYLFILPGVWKYGYYHMDEDKYVTNRQGYIWDTVHNKCLETRILPPTVENGKKQWGRIRACAASDELGLLIAMDGENNTFFFYLHPERGNQTRDWEKFDGNPLPKFMGETSFAASNGRLYILEVGDESPAFLYIYDIKERKLVMDEKPIPWFDNDLWSMDKWDRVVRLVSVAHDKLCFLWLGPVSNEIGNGWPPVRSLHYLKVSIRPKSAVEVEDSKVFPTNITYLLSCLPCDRKLFGAEAISKSPPHTQDVDAIRAPGKNEVVMDHATTSAARENTILFQAVVPSGERKLEMNAWFKIQPRAQIFGPFHCRQPYRSGISSTFVGSFLYTIGGQVPSSKLPKSGYISWLDTRSPFNGWEIGELPSPCVDSVICVYGDFLCIFTEPEGYIWNTRVNECLETRILPPKVKGGRRQWRRIRACVALDEKGLLIAMDGEKKNFFLYKPEENEWKICKFEDPLPKFTGKTSFAASNGKLYILEFEVDFPALYIYDIKKRKLVKGKMDIRKSARNLPSIDNWERVTFRLVPVADDKLCFLVLGPDPYEILHCLKLKFSFNPNPSNSEVEVEIDQESESFSIKNVTNLLDCLPCGPEQFTAEVDLLDAFQKQREDNASRQAMRTCLISDKPLHFQAEDFASPKGGERKRKRTELGDPLLLHKRKKKKLRKVALEHENKRLREEIASLKVQVDETSERLAEKKEQYAVRHKEEKQCRGDPSVEVTEEKRDAARSEKLKADDAISEDELDEALDYLTEAGVLNRIPVALYVNEGGDVVFVKFNKSNAAIRDANAAFERKVEQAKALEHENKPLRDENASLKAQVDEISKGLTEEEVEQYAVREKEKEQGDNFNMTEPGQSCEAKNPSFSSGDDDELDNTDVVEPDNDPLRKMRYPSVEVTEEKRDAAESEILKANDAISEGKLDEAIDYLTKAIMLDNIDVVEPDNDPLQKMGDPSVLVTEEKQDAAQSEMLEAVDAIFEGKLDEAIDYLTEAIMLNPKSAILYATRASVFVKLNKPNAAIRDANAALEINPDSAKGYKIRGIANAMLGWWEEATDDLGIALNLDYDKEVGSVLKKIEEHRTREYLWKERKVKRAENPIKISFGIYDIRQQKFEQDPEALSAFKDGQVIGIHSTTELETKLNAATKASRLAILYFTAKWCPPSVIMSPIYTSLAAKYREVVFLKVDIDEARGVAERWNISGVPTFFFIRNGNVVDEVRGSNEGALERKTAKYAIQSFLDKM